MGFVQLDKAEGYNGADDDRNDDVFHELAGREIIYAALTVTSGGRM